MVKHFDKCLCTNLRTGTIIIGVLGLLSGLYFISSALLNVSTESGKRNESSGGSATRIIAGIIGLCEIILNGVLIYGAVKRMPKLVRPWVLITTVLLVLYVINTLATGIIACVGGQLTTGLAVLIGGLIGALINVYFILIVNSYHTTLLSGDPVATQSA